jgi:hypothetical protein
VIAAAVYVDRLRAQAEAAAATETAWRKEAATRTEQLARKRAEAFRRWNVLRDMGEAMRGVADRDHAVGAGIANVRERLGWPSVPSDSQQEVLTALRPVALAMLEPEGDVGGSVTTFEDWFLTRTGRGFWTLLDQPVVDTPVVDF